MIFKCFKKNNFQRSIISLFSGCCGTLSFSPYDIWPAAIFSLTGLLSVTLECNIKKSAYFGFIWGLGFFNTGINWIYISISQFGGMPNTVNIIIFFLLSIYLSFYPMLFSIFLSWIWPKTSLCRLMIGAPVLWSIIECLRGWIFTGFPWLQFGYSQIDGPIKGIAPILGVEAITFILMMISGIISFSIKKRRPILQVLAAFMFIIPWSLSFIQWYNLQPHRSIDIALVQGNILQNIKWNIDKISAILEIYLKETLPLLGKVKIIIWPETAIPNNECDQQTFLYELDKKLQSSKTSLITGIIDARKTFSYEDYHYNYKYYNSILVLGTNNTYRYSENNHYDKNHLVPFGETIPFKNIFPKIAQLFNLPMSDLSQGKYLQPQLIVADIKITASICYEIILGKQIRDNFKPDTDILLSISNDAWFGNSIGPWQHFQMARMRALELGRPLLRSTNTGITAVIYADGTTQVQIPQFKRTVLTVKVIPTNGITPYARFGSFPLWIIIFISGIFSIFFENSWFFNKKKN